MSRPTIILGFLLLALALILIFERAGQSRGRSEFSGDDPVDANSSHGSRHREKRGTLAVRGDSRQGRLLEDSGAWFLQGHEDAEETGVAAWRFVDDELLASDSGTISRKVRTPRFAKLSFSLESSDQFIFDVRLLAEGPGLDSKNHLQLRITERYFSLRDTWSDDSSSRSQTLGSVTSQPREGRMTVDLYLSREDRAVVLFVDGKREMVGWNITSKAANADNWLQLTSLKQCRLSVLDMSLSAWNGPLPDGSELLREFGEARARYTAMTGAASEWDGLKAFQVAADSLSSTRSPFEKPMTEDLRNHYQAVVDAVPIARRVPGAPDMAINPYTREHVDVRGFPGKTVLRDPDEPDCRRVFRLE